MSQKIPDPTDRSTFEHSRIEWSEIDRSPHREVLSQTRHLLNLRRTEIVPLLKSEYRGSHYTISPDKVLDVTWRFSQGTLRLLANFGDSTISAPSDMDGQVLWSSPDLDLSGKGLLLPPWSTIIRKGVSA
jgi:maltooligosyltrehalose trehalohydrolase